MQLSKYDYKRILRKNISKYFLQTLLHHLKTTKPFLLSIVSLSIYERFAVAYALAQKILQLREKQKCKVFYVFNQEELETKLKQARTGDIFIVDIPKPLEFRKSIELKNLNYLILSSGEEDYPCPYKLKILKETEKLYCCLLVKDNPIGTVYIKKQEINYDRLLEELRTPVEKIIENVEYSTEQMLKKMYIPKEIIFMKKKNELRKTENGIISQKILIYGDVGTGKSTLLEIFNGLDIQTYGQEHVYSRLHEADLQSLLVRGWSSHKQHYIQSINVEDLTYADVKDLFTMHAYINLRHTMNERSGGSRADRSTGIQQGIAKCRICLHRLTGDATPPAFRSSFDFQLFLCFPTLKFDRDFIEQIIGPVYVSVLKYITEKRNAAKEKGDVEAYKKWLGWGVWVYGEEIGVFHLSTDYYAPVAIELLDAPAGEETEEEVTHWQDWEIQVRNQASEHLAFQEVDFGGSSIRINLWGSRSADIPRWDVDLTEQFLIENYPETKELIPKRRKALAKDVFKRAKYLQYSKIAPERIGDYYEEENEKEEQFQWANENWLRIAEEGVKYFINLGTVPTIPEIRKFILPHWRFNGKTLPRTINRINFWQQISDHIRVTLKKEFEGVYYETQENTVHMPNYQGSIVQKYEQAIRTFGKKQNIERAIEDLIANQFHNESYTDIGKRRGVGKNTISGNINDVAKPKLDKVSGDLWEQSIFIWVLEYLEKIATEKEFNIYKFVNNRLVDSFPAKQKDDIFIIAANVHTPIHCESLAEIYPLSPNPPFLLSFSSFLSGPFSFLFFWLGGKSSVDFLFFSKSGVHLVFDAKVSHQNYTKDGRKLTSFTIKNSKLKPQRLYLEQNPDAKGYVAFWSPNTGDKLKRQKAPGDSVTVNLRCHNLQRSLEELLSEAIFFISNRKECQKPKKVKGRKVSERGKERKRKEKKEPNPPHKE